MLVAGAALIGAACERSGGGHDSAGDAQAVATPAPLAPGWDKWTREAAHERLDQREVAVSAALRLVQLAEIDPLCAPPAVSADWFDRLRVVQVGTGSHALGLADAANPRRLRAPVIIDSAGIVTRVTDGVDEELLILHLGDTERFPHVAFCPGRVWVIEDELVSAIVLDAGARLRFEVRTEAEGEVLVLLAPGPQGETEAARYLWSPVELAFMGPAALDLPEPPGGSFEIDLQHSERLEPVGGRMPAPKENPSPPDLDQPRPQQRDV